MFWRHNAKVNMFADDIKMYMKIINDVDLAQLQCALNSLAEWAHQWQLAISIDKCCIFYWETCVISSSQSWQLCTAYCVADKRSRCGC